MNMPTEHSIKEMKLVPSAYSPAMRRVGSYILMFALLFLLINNIITINTLKEGMMRRTKINKSLFLLSPLSDLLLVVFNHLLGVPCLQNVLLHVGDLAVLHLHLADPLFV
jgi:hypothetical protein